MTKKIFLTFANIGYYNTNIISNQAKSFNLFDKILEYNENNIPEFIYKHKHFIYNNYGFGMWIWKPKIIYDVLNTMDDDDILLYCDSGTYLNINGKNRLLDYFDLLKHNSIITFSAGSQYKAKDWIKNDVIMNYYPNMHNENDDAVYAGVMIIKKNESSLSLIKEWLELCENYHYLDKSSSILYKEKDYFKGHDCDNALFNLCISKFKIDFKINSNETNIFTNEGLQIHHSNIKINSDTWNPLNDKPIQIRRLNKN